MFYVVVAGFHCMDYEVHVVMSTSWYLGDMVPATLGVRLKNGYVQSLNTLLLLGGFPPFSLNLNTILTSYILGAVTCKVEVKSLRERAECSRV
jgi:hypothetical protein